MRVQQDDYVYNTLRKARKCILVTFPKHSAR